jgi:hypothetical protein
MLEVDYTACTPEVRAELDRDQDAVFSAGLFMQILGMRAIVTDRDMRDLRTRAHLCRYLLHDVIVQESLDAFVNFCENARGIRANVSSYTLRAWASKRTRELVRSAEQAVKEAGE